MYAEGTAVRNRNDPSQVGVATAETKISGGRLYQWVRLASGDRKLLLHMALEPVTAAPDALADLRKGRFSHRSALSHTLTHIRLTGRLADLIYSMESTNTEFHAYQFKPVVKILNAASKGLLIADEVGLGKTIEAGLVWTELVARYDMQRLLVVCPKSLQEKWRMELSQKFGVRAQAVDAADLLQVLQEHERTGEDFAVVATLSGIRAPKNWDDPDEPAKSARADLARYLRDRIAGDPLFDLVIFDEAHHLRNSETAQHRTARQIVELADYKLMLSATPINLRSEDLRSILRLVEPDLFDREWIFNQLQTENVPIVAARECALRTDATFTDLEEAIDQITPGRFLKTDGRLAEERTPCLKMHGSVKRDRNEILREFRDGDGRMVLLTSEVGGEGLDLQFCRVLINYDLPWNPMKVEQRIGRIDRIGQKSPSVEILSLICEGTIEEQIYRRLYERLNLIVQTLGGYEPRGDRPNR